MHGLAQKCAIVRKTLNLPESVQDFREHFIAKVLAKSQNLLQNEFYRIFLSVSKIFMGSIKGIFMSSLMLITRQFCVLQDEMEEVVDSAAIDHESGKQL